MTTSQNLALAVLLLVESLRAEMKMLSCFPKKRLRQHLLLQVVRLLLLPKSQNPLLRLNLPILAAS